MYTENIPFLAFLVSIATASFAYSQMKIASAKIKLDLYNKRFNVYLSALDYYQATVKKKNTHEEIKECGDQFAKFYRESKFLFEQSDGVYETLKQIQLNGSRIQFYEQHKFERDNNLTNDRHDLPALGEQSANARDDFEKNLLKLEKQIEKYIQFTTIAGWK